MRAVVIVVSALALSACGGPSEESPQEEAARKAETQRVLREADEMLRGNPDGTVAAFSQDGQPITLDIRQVENRAILDEMSGSIYSAGQPCGQVTAFYDLLQNGEVIAFSENGRSGGVFKADCETGASYQITSINGRVFVKPWTGRIFGN